MQASNADSGNVFYHCKIYIHIFMFNFQLLFFFSFSPILVSVNMNFYFHFYFNMSTCENEKIRIAKCNRGPEKKEMTHYTCITCIQYFIHNNSETNINR